MDRKRLGRRGFLRWTVFAGCAVLAGCASQAGATSQVVEKVVTQEVEKEKIVEKVVTAAPAAQPTPSGLKADLTVWVWHNNEDQIELVKPIFNSYFPEVKVTPVTLGFTDLHTKLFTCLAAGSGAPDISWVELSQLGKFVYFGTETGLLDLTPFIDRDNLRGNFLGWALKNCMSQDKAIMALPRAICPAVTFYRRDHFEEAGLPSDPDQVGEQLKDWDGWIEAASKIADTKKERWFLENLEAQGPVFATLGGANYFDANGNLRIGTDPIFDKLLAYHVQGREMNIDMAGTAAAGGAAMPESQAAIKGGNIATVINGAWWSMFLQNFASDTSGKWGMVNVPGVKGANGGGDYVVIPSQGKQIEAAWEFCKFAATDVDAARAWLTFGGVGSITGWKPAYVLPDWDRTDNFYGGQKVLLLVRTVLEEMPDMILTPNDPIASAALSKYVGECVRTHGDPATYLKKAHDEALSQMEK